MKTSNLLPEACMKDLEERLIELQSERKMQSNSNFDGCIELLKWVLTEDDKK